MAAEKKRKNMLANMDVDKVAGKKKKEQNWLTWWSWWPTRR